MGSSYLCRIAGFISLQTKFTLFTVRHSQAGGREQSPIRARSPGELPIRHLHRCPAHYQSLHDLPHPPQLPHYRGLHHLPHRSHATCIS